MRRNLLISLTFVLVPLLTSCASTRPTPRQEVHENETAMASPQRYETRFDNAVSQFGSMLRAYPLAFDEPVLIEVPPIENISGVTDGLPTDLAPILRVIMGKMGDPVEVVQFDPKQLYIDSELHRMDSRRRATMVRRIPRISIRGSITEGESRYRRGRGLQADALLPVRSGNEVITTHPGGSVTTIQRDEEIDAGLSKEQEIEVITLAIDLQLFDFRSMTSIDRLAESYRIDVVRVDNSMAFGIFFEGSGIGIRSRTVAIQSKGLALRMASELALIHLLGRYFQVPWWRVVTDTLPDEQLVRWYHDGLAIDDTAAGKLKLLLYAHGHQANLAVAEVTPEESAISRGLKQSFGMDPDARNDYELITRLWQTAPYDVQAERRMESLRRTWRKQVREARSQGARRNPPPNQPTATPPSTGRPTEATATTRLRYPTVSKCCPFRFDPLPEPPPDHR